VVLRYYVRYPADMTAANLMHTDVPNLEDKRIGRIEDLVIGNGREITAIVIGRASRRWTSLHRPARPAPSS